MMNACSPPRSVLCFDGAGAHAGLRRAASRRSRILNVNEFHINDQYVTMKHMATRSTTNGGPAPGPTRRAPVQPRSRRRLEDILAVTARLVDDVGPDSVTTTLIADHLGISVGSIYAYFVDRSAIFDEIVARAIAQHETLVESAREQLADASWLEGSIAVIDTLVHIYRTEPGFRSLWFSQHLSAEMIETMRRSDETRAQHLLGRLEASGLRLNSASPMNSMRMYVGVIDKGLDLAFHLDPKGDPAMIEETKKVVRHYIERFLEPLTTKKVRKAPRPVARR